jgi:type VI secretion system secreted protein VgrG
VSTQGLDAAYADAPEKRTTPDASKLPHSGEPILTLAGKGGLALVAGQSLQWSNSETVSLMSGQDSQSITGGQFRVHSGQAIGVLAGAVGVGEEGKGLSLIAGKDPVRYEAQSNAIQIQAKQLINIQSANSHIDWAAAKKISLSTADGANITIEGGNITIQCPGTLTVHAASKTFDGPDNKDFVMPTLPKGTLAFDEKFRLVDASDEPIAHMRYEIAKQDGTKTQGVSDAQGNIPLLSNFNPEKIKLRMLGKVKQS